MWCHTAEGGGRIPLIDVVMHDEKQFVANVKTREVYVLQEDDPHLISLKKGKSGSVMVSGIYDRHGRGPLCFVDEGDTIDACHFSRMLEKDFLPFFKQRKKHVGLFDNAKPHVAFTTKATFFSLGLKKVKHCANSPDYNPIELVWSRMQHMVQQNLPWGKNITIAMLKKEIQRAWVACATSELFEKDCMHVTDCMLKSLACNGGNMYKK